MVAVQDAASIDSPDKDDDATGASFVELTLLFLALLTTIYPSKLVIALVDTPVLAASFGFALARGRSRTAIIPLLFIWLPLNAVAGSSTRYHALVPGVALFSLTLPILRLLLPNASSKLNFPLALLIAIGGAISHVMLSVEHDHSYDTPLNAVFIIPLTFHAYAAFAGWLLARQPRLRIANSNVKVSGVIVTVLTTVTAAFFVGGLYKGILLVFWLAVILVADTFDTRINNQLRARVLYSALVIAGPARKIIDNRVCVATTNAAKPWTLFVCDSIRCGESGTRIERISRMVNDCTNAQLFRFVALPLLLACGGLFCLFVQFPIESSLQRQWPSYVAHWPIIPYPPKPGKAPKRNNSDLERAFRVVAYYIFIFTFFWTFMRTGIPVTKFLSTAGRNPVLCQLPQSVYRCSREGVVKSAMGTLERWSGTPQFKLILLFCRIVSLLSLPSFILNIIGQIAFPRANWKRLRPTSELVKRSNFVMYFRYVTRGTSTNLVLENCRQAARTLRSTGIPDEVWRVEVVTDNVVGVSNLDDRQVYELVVPKSYTPPGGALYKARALQYAIEKSPAGDEDWIIHLDEETQFDADTVNAIVQHCVTQAAAVRAGHLQWPSVGQGLIVYGRAMLPSLASANLEGRSWLTSLADSVRVADDCGRFRLQYECGEVWFGMHGSYVVAPNSVERAITFDHGVEGSIAEDAHFALAARARGVRFAWVDAIMYEQSPFTLRDFVRQRARWLVGGLLVVNNSRLPLGVRAVMGTLSALWAAMPLAYLCVTAAVLLGSLEHGEPGFVRNLYVFMLPISVGLGVWSYLLGYFVTFYAQGLGVVRFIALLVAQLAILPVFGLMELCGVIYALLNFRKLSHGFHVVQKDASESTPLLDSSETPTL